MGKEHTIPKWLFYTCVAIVALGGAGLITGNLQWGITSEENMAIILTIFSSLILFFNSISNLIKRKK